MQWNCDAVRENVHLCTRAKLGLIFLLNREVMALCLSRIFLCFILFSVPGDKKKKKLWICSTLGLILSHENMTFKNLRTHLETQGLYMESKTRSWGSSSFRVLPFDHIQRSGLITCAYLLFFIFSSWSAGPEALQQSCWLLVHRGHRLHPVSTSWVSSAGTSRTCSLLSHHGVTCSAWGKVTNPRHLWHGVACTLDTSQLHKGWKLSKSDRKWTSTLQMSESLLPPELRCVQ